MKRALPLLLLVLLCRCGGSGGGDATKHPRPTAWNPDDPGLSARLDDAFARWAAEHSAIGAAGAVYTPGWLDWTGATGVVSTDTNTPFTVDSVGRVASATKPFTATLIFKLRDEGKISLDTKLAQFIPDYPNGDRITVEDLLRHRSGIPELQLADGFFIGTAILEDQHWFTPLEIMDWTHLPIPMLDVLDGTLVPRKPVTVPGGDFHYAQPNFIALGMMIESITGQKLADVYAERILRPLRLEHTHLPVMDEPLDPDGYSNLFGLLPKRIPTSSLVQSGNSLNSSAWSAGGMVSSAHDLVTFLSALLEGRLYSAEDLADAQDWLPTDDNTPVGEGDDYGMALDRQTHDGLTYIGHDGALPGSSSTMKYVPQLDVYIGDVTNCDLVSLDGARDLELRVAHALRNEPQD